MQMQWRVAAKHEAAPGVVLLAATVLAMLLANLLPWVHAWLVGWRGWINDGLMAVFFLQVGLELKRELLIGHLATRHQAALPAIAAAGGMLCPALIYLLVNRADPIAMRGWAIPTATDIAFALGALSLMGSRVPASLRAFLLGVAIFDDLGAVAIIGIFYSHGLWLPALCGIALMLGVLLLMNRANVRHGLLWALAGFALWLAVLYSGLHATLAGVALAMFIPLGHPGRRAAAHGLSHRLEQGLHPWVVFGILPLFALTNAGMSLAGVSLQSLLQSVPLGVVLGLLLGKQVGIVVASWLAVRCRLAALPAAVSWKQLHGVALLCGIGFTMSLFMAALAARGAAGSFALAPLGVLAGSLLSGCAGLLLLRKVATAPGPTA